jgi:hypothetical protein
MTRKRNYFVPPDLPCLPAGRLCQREELDYLSLPKGGNKIISAFAREKRAAGFLLLTPTRALPHIYE